MLERRMAVEKFLRCGCASGKSEIFRAIRRRIFQLRWHARQRRTPLRSGRRNVVVGGDFSADWDSPGVDGTGEVDQRLADIGRRQSVLRNRGSGLAARELLTNCARDLPGCRSPSGRSRRRCDSRCGPPPSSRTACVVRFRGSAPSSSSSSRTYFDRSALSCRPCAVAAETASLHLTTSMARQAQNAGQRVHCKIQLQRILNKAGRNFVQDYPKILDCGFKKLLITTANTSYLALSPKSARACGCPPDPPNWVSNP